MKIVIGVLIVIVAILGWQLIERDTTNNQLRGQLNYLTIKLKDKTVHENLEQKEKCATQADKVFRQLGYDLNGGGTLQNHFNIRLNKCFMSVGTSIKDFSFLFLIDAYEQKGYAELSESRSSFDCSLTPPAEEKRTCKSRSEYEAFTSNYME